MQENEDFAARGLMPDYTEELDRVSKFVLHYAQ